MSLDRRPLAIALMGPTASGKSALALDWARRFDGEIVSVDSALVYRGLEIGAAKPTARERAGVPHHMIDVRDPWEPYSAAQFATDAHAAITSIIQKGRLPILVGGTGLYFRALLQGLAAMPEADAAVRAGIAAEAAERGWAYLHAQLAEVDPKAAVRIHATDAQRIQRALEVFRLSGKPISVWQRESQRDRLECRVLKMIIAPTQRSTLHARIARRFNAMLATGFLEEVLRLRALPQLQALAQPLDLPALRSVGYRQAWQSLSEGWPVDTLRERAIFATRQLAKRQLTWLRGQHDAFWCDPETERKRMTAILEGFIFGHTSGMTSSLHEDV